MDCKWRYLTVKQFFTGASLSCQGVYARFNKWRKDRSWQQAWLNVLRLQKYRLDCSGVQLDGSNTPAKNGGAAVGYQGRKKARTTTALFLTDNRQSGPAPSLRYPASEQPPRQLPTGRLV